MKRIRGGGPEILLPADIPMVTVIVVAVAAAALRAAARRPGLWRLLGAEPAPVAVTAANDRPQSAVIADVHRIAGPETATLPGPSGRPAGSFEQMRYVFHELHAEGHHAFCEVCGN
jgi:hypothetical protein